VCVLARLCAECSRITESVALFAEAPSRPPVVAGPQFISR